MALHTLDPAAFRLLFPAFASAVKFPDERLEANWTLATGYVQATDGPLLADGSLQSALNLLTAHLLQISVFLAAGMTTVAPLIGSTVDKVQVQLAPPPYKNGWQWWLASTPYGAQFWALLRAKAPRGLYVGGSPERYGFRRVGGGFGPGGWC